MKQSNFLLYLSYTVSCLEYRSWAFAVALVMQEMGGMRMVSMQQFAEGVAQMLLSGSMGKYFDGCSRRKGISIVVPANNLSSIGACVCFVICLSITGGESAVVYSGLLALGLLLCSVSCLAQSGERNILGKDWVVVLEEEGDLSKLNAIVTSLDQLSNVAAPLLAGGLLTVFGLRTTCIIFGCASLFSLLLKSAILTRLLATVPRLHVRKGKKTGSLNNKKDVSLMQSLLGSFKVVAVYTRQFVFPAALGASLFHMSVLGFKGHAISYAHSAGLPISVIGGFRSYGSLVGVAGAILYAYFERTIGVRRTGMFGLTFQLGFLLLAVLSIWMPGSPMDISGYFESITFQEWWQKLKSAFDPSTSSLTSDAGLGDNSVSKGCTLTSIVVFMVGISTARFGLWVANLSITQIIQEDVPEMERNTVFGVHNSLGKAFSVLKDVMVIILPEPSTFALCVLVSYGFGLCGYVAYLYYLAKDRETSPTQENRTLASNTKQDPVAAEVDSEPESKLLTEGNV